MLALQCSGTSVSLKNVLLANQSTNHSTDQPTQFRALRWACKAYSNFRKRCPTLGMQSMLEL
jgi:hypothetical protein